MSRITFGQVNSITQTQLSNNYTRVSKLQEQLSSGKAILRPSDAPIDTTNTMELRSSINSMDQYQRNSNDAMSYLSVIDTTLTGSTAIFQKARERAIQGSSDTLTAQDRGFIGQEVRESILNQMISLSSTSYKGDFLFSGHKTSTPPYTLEKGTESIDATDNTGTNPDDTFLTTVPSTIQIWDRSLADSNTVSTNPRAERMVPGSLTIPGLEETTDYDVDYLAGTITFKTAAATAQAAGGGIDLEYDWIRHTEEDISGEINRQIDKGVDMQINVNADQVFGTTTEEDSFDSMIKLLQGLHTNDSTQINDSITGLDKAIDRTMNSASVIGARFNRLDSSFDRMDSRIIETQRIQSELEDLDFAKAISDFNLASSVYEASLQSASRVISKSLMDYV